MLHDSLSYNLEERYLRVLGVKEGISFFGARAADWAAEKSASQRELCRQILSPLPHTPPDDHRMHQQHHDKQGIGTPLTSVAPTIRGDTDETRGSEDEDQEQWKVHVQHSTNPLDGGLLWRGPVLWHESLEHWPKELRTGLHRQHESNINILKRASLKSNSRSRDGTRQVWRCHRGAI